MKKHSLIFLLKVTFVFFWLIIGCTQKIPDPLQIVEENGTGKGICVIAGEGACEAAIDLAGKSDFLIHDNKLYMAGGTSISPAIYDLNNGSCLNDPGLLKLQGSACPRGSELFKFGDAIVVCGHPLYRHPEYPVYDPSVHRIIFRTSMDGLDVYMENNRMISCCPSIDEEKLTMAVDREGRIAVALKNGQVMCYGL